MDHRLLNELEVSSTSAGKIALQLYLKRSEMNDSLEYELPSNWSGPKLEKCNTHEIVNGRIKFLSLKARNDLLTQYLANSYFSNEEIDVLALFSIAHDLWIHGRHSNDMVSGQFLSIINIRHDPFLLAIAALEKGMNWVQVCNALESLLEYQESVPISNLPNFFQAYDQAAKGDLAAGRFYSVLEGWLTTRPSLARDIIKIQPLVANESAVQLYATSLLALSRNNSEESVDELLNNQESGSWIDLHHKIWICGRMLVQDHITALDQKRLKDLIIEGIRHERSDVRLQAVKASVNNLHRDDTFDEELIKAALSKDQDILSALANALYMNSTELKKNGKFFDWLPFLTHLDCSHGLDDLDYVLSTSLTESSEDIDAVIDFLTNWALIHGDGSIDSNKFAKTFNCSVLKISANPELSSKVITAWLSHDDRNLAVASSSILTEFILIKPKQIKFDSALLNKMNAQDLLFLVRKLLGFVHDTQQLLSLSLSALNVSNEYLEHTISILNSLIVDEIGYDYPNSTLEALNIYLETEARVDVINAIQRWKAVIEKSIKERESLPSINELLPSTKLRRKFAHARSKQMQKAQQKANENSIIQQIATTIPLKAGKGFFNYRQGVFMTPTPLSSYSYSIELPRREVLDSIGNAIRGLHFRIAKRTDP